MLQPHKGPSETRPLPASISVTLVLQPHKGPSETASEARDLYTSNYFGLLQPHKSPSETKLLT